MSELKLDKRKKIILTGIALTEEVTITLNAIRDALLDKSYMTKGIKEKLKLQGR